ncbi:hypothetical protein VTI28DRAFT_9442 [Corynascus sepedonium]
MKYGPPANSGSWPLGPSRSVAAGAVQRPTRPTMCNVGGPDSAAQRSPHPRSGRGLPWPILRCGKIRGSASNKNDHIVAMSATLRAPPGAPGPGAFAAYIHRAPKEAAAITIAAVLPPAYFPCLANCFSWQPGNVASSGPRRPTSCPSTNTRPGEQLPEPSSMATRVSSLPTRAENPAPRSELAEAIHAAQRPQSCPDWP